ncbi:rho GTPase-activating protein 27 [Rhinophrynus dorsalis]
MPQISSTQSGSLQDIPVAHESSSIDTVQIFSQDHTDAGRSFTPMRTFNNSKKIVDPSKRISYLCSYDPQPNIRSTQSLENINTEPSIDQNQQTQRTNDSCRGLHHVKPVTTEQSNKAGSKESLSPSQAVKEEAAEEKEEIVSPIYVNINDIRKEGARERLSSRQHSSTSTLEDWETHTDKDSGQLFYYNSVTGATTWDSPFDQPEDQVHSPLSQASLSPLPGDNEWEKHFDEASGLFFFYNSVTGETSWEPPIEEGMNFQGMKPGFSLYSSTDRRPPTPEADYPDYSPEELENYPDADYDLDHPAMYDSLPPDKPYGDQTTGWYCQINKDGKKCFTNSFNNETWLQSEDQYGKTYFYTPDGAFSQWSLPQVGPPSIQSRYSEPDQDNEIFTNWNNNFTAFALQKDVREISPLHRRSDSENSFLNYSGHQHQTKSLEKAGVLHKTKIAENGKRLRKNWSSSWTVLEGGILTFFKDGKNLSSNSLKSQSVLTTPEHTVRLQGAKLGWAAKDKSSKKNVLDLKTLDGCEYLIHHDSETITADWYTSIQNSIGRNIRTSTEQPLEDEVDSAQEFGSNEKLVLKDEKEKEKKSQGHSSNSSNSDSDRNVRAKLKKFLQRRPTLQSLKDKGYIKEQVFGCPLNQLCEREKQNVPAFVKKAIQAVEKRGLDIDGLYRVSGNLAIIQKLRYKVDHDENFNLDDGRWEDVHVITGALKLFFRELPEPLFPYSHFDKFIEAIKISDQTQKRKVLKDLVQSLPPPNLETMRLLFRHLCSVIEYREANRMSVQSVAIVFGPTLLRPETEGTNIAMFMVFQNQIVEQILNNYKYIFNVS